MRRSSEDVRNEEICSRIDQTTGHIDGLHSRAGLRGTVGGSLLYKLFLITALLKPDWSSVVGLLLAKITKLANGRTLQKSVDIPASNEVYKTHLQPLKPLMAAPHETGIQKTQIK